MRRLLYALLGLAICVTWGGLRPTTSTTATSALRLPDDWAKANLLQSLNLRGKTPKLLSWRTVQYKKAVLHWSDYHNMPYDTLYECVLVHKTSAGFYMYHLQSLDKQHWQNYPVHSTAQAAILPIQEARKCILSNHEEFENRLQYWDYPLEQEVDWQTASFAQRGAPKTVALFVDQDVLNELTEALQQ